MREIVDAANRNSGVMIAVIGMAAKCPEGMQPLRKGWTGWAHKQQGESRYDYPLSDHANHLHLDRDKLQLVTQPRDARPRAIFRLCKWSIIPMYARPRLVTLRPCLKETLDSHCFERLANFAKILNELAEAFTPGLLIRCTKR